MEYGKLKVTVDYGDGFTSEATYHAFHFVNEGTDVSCLMDVNSVDHAAQIHFDVDVTKNPQGIFGSADNIAYEWIQEPVVTGCYIVHGDNLNDFMEPGVYCRAIAGSDSNIVTNVPEEVGTSTFVLEVFRGGGSGQVTQRLTACLKGSEIIAVRSHYANAWGDWAINRFDAHATFATSMKIYGTTPDGELRDAFCPINANGNTVVGKGNYDKGDGDTNILGNEVNIQAKNKIDLKGPTYLGGSLYDADGVKIGEKDGYTSDAGEVFAPSAKGTNAGSQVAAAGMTVSGNLVQFNLTLKLLNAVNSGNIVNYKLGKLVKEPVQLASFASSATGPMASFYAGADGYLYMSAVASALSAGDSVSVAGLYMYK